MDYDTSILTIDTNTDQSNILFREPKDTDGSAVFELINRCKPLDVNSMYCNLLQCSHFAQTSIAAERSGEIIGFISGYRLPQQPDTLFVWQVAVDASARGMGLASRMLTTLLQRLGGDIRHLHTSITASNEASWNTFRRLAETLNAPLNSSMMFDRERHFGGAHDSESLVHIGPFNITSQE
ncbi:diaminobutyrate acetyltransferase [Thalassolituus marinus]|uniref:L-2,4-diaminobutyric acid acetyltransferase n=1 Tax=Thalassolituus marinus TaxID=671053 RepID=A0ABS7ZQT2_9GAMM|nr:diaminobutyrate acetyltransferase [Thalassolituus marinus]MCA6063533.1 diaminobutyrate acetyltransferase [Thalassolituus marinus]